MLYYLVVLLIIVVAITTYRHVEGFNTPDPCQGVTDNTLAKDVSDACLQKMWLDAGCSAEGTVYPATGTKKWYNQSPNGANVVYCGGANTGDKCGAGSVKVIKEDMAAWARMMDQGHVVGCRGPKCRAVTTQFDDEGGGNAVYLDRHVMSCRADEAISQIHLVRSGAGTYQYQYTCCKLPGPPGPAGAVGPAGPIGPAGIAGAAGARGANGAPGTPGVAGSPGLPGVVGPAGKDGAMGPMGPMGVMGPMGPAGEMGPMGPAGAMGPRGPRGLSSDSQPAPFGMPSLEEIQSAIRDEFQNIE